MTVGDQRYELMGLRFHTPSEHRIDGALAAMELHLVRQIVGESLRPDVHGSTRKVYEDYGILQCIARTIPPAATGKGRQSMNLKDVSGQGAEATGVRHR